MLNTHPRIRTLDASKGEPRWRPGRSPSHLHDTTESVLEILPKRRKTDDPSFPGGVGTGRGPSIRRGASSTIEQ